MDQKDIIRMESTLRTKNKTMDKFIRQPLHKIRDKNEMLIEISETTFTSLQSVIAVDGIFDYLLPHDLLNFFYAFPEFKSEHSYRIKFKRKFATNQYKSLLIKTGLMYLTLPKPNVYKVKLNDEMPILEVDSTGMEEFIRHYGPFLEKIRFIKNFYEFNIFANKYEQYNFYCEMFDANCNSLEAILEKYSWTHVQIIYPDKLLRVAEAELVKIFLTDGVLKYLEKRDIFNLIEAYKPTFLFSRVLFRNVLFQHVTRQSEEFHEIIIYYNYSNLMPKQSYKISNGEFFNLNDLSWPDLVIVMHCIGHHIKSLEYYHSTDFYTASCHRRDLIMDLVNAKCKNLEVFKIGSNRVTSKPIGLFMVENLKHDFVNADMNMKFKKGLQKMTDEINNAIQAEIGEPELKLLNELYPFLANIKVNIIKNRTELRNETNPIKLSSNLTSRKRIIEKVDISSDVADFIVDSSHFHDILTLPQLERLTISSAYNMIPTWNILSEIKMRTRDKIFPALKFLTINGQSEVEYIGKSIEEFLTATTNLPNNRLQQRQLRHLKIQNYGFRTFETREDYFLQPNWLVLENCSFKDDAHDCNMLKYFPNVECLEFVNTEPLDISRLSNLSTVQSFHCTDCPSLTNQQLMKIYKRCPEIRTYKITNCPITDDFFYEIMYLKLEEQNVYENTIFNLNLPTFLIQDLQSCSNEMLSAFNDAPKWHVKILYEQYPMQIIVEPDAPEPATSTNELSERYQQFVGLSQTLIPNMEFFEVMKSNSDNMHDQFSEMKSQLMAAFDLLNELKTVAQKTDQIKEETASTSLTSSVQNDESIKAKLDYDFYLS